MLEEHHDDRYLYFNNKIYSLMVRKEVIEELHKDTQSRSSKKEALELAAKRDLDAKKSEMDLQMYLQKEAYTLSSIKDLLKKEEKITTKRTESIKRGIQHQNQALEERIQHRRMRSNSKGNSKGKDKKKEAEQVVLVSIKTYQTKKTPEKDYR